MSSICSSKSEEEIVISQQIKSLIAHDLGDGDDLLEDEDFPNQQDWNDVEDQVENNFQHYYSDADTSYEASILRNHQVAQRDFTDAEKWRQQQQHHQKQYQIHHKYENVVDESSEDDEEGGGDCRPQQQQECNKMKSVRFSTPLLSPSAKIYHQRQATSTPKVSTGGRITSFTSPERESRKVEALHYDQDVNSETKESSAELIQLQILYKARGKKLDQVNQQMIAMSEEFEREKRMSNHQLLICKEELKESNMKIEELETCVEEKNEALSAQEKECKTLSAEHQAEREQKIKMEKELEVCERAVEHLQQQLSTLQRSDTLERARHENDVIIAASEERHKREMFEVEKRLQQVESMNNEKSEECEILKERLKKSLKQTEDVLLEKSEIINQLSHNLQEAQHQTQTLLAGGGEAPYLKQLVENLSTKNKELERQLNYEKKNSEELEQQVKSYELCMQIGAESKPVKSRYQESYTDFMAFELQEEDPSTAVKTSTKPHENLANKLRKELERSLAVNKEKREKTQRLEDEVRELTEKCEQLQCEAKLDQKKDKVDSESKGIQTEDDDENDDMKDKYEKLKEELHELKQQLFKTIETHDRDKEEALERREQALLALYKERQAEICEQMTEDFNQEIERLNKEHEEVIASVRQANNNLSSELNDVKTRYVQVCDELKQTDTTLNKQFQQKIEQMMLNHDEALNEMEAKLQEEKNQSEKDYDKLVQAKISSEREQWEDEVKTIKNEVAQQTKKECEHIHNARVYLLEREHENKLKILLQKEKEKLEKFHKAEALKSMKSEVDEIKQKLQLSYQSKLKRIQESVNRSEQDSEMKWQKRVEELEISGNEKLQLQISKCHRYEEEIEELQRGIDSISKKDENENHRILNELRENHKKEIQVLKTRIGGEYRRWKQERMSMVKEVDRLEKEVTDKSNMYKQMFIELQKVFVSALVHIKDDVGKMMVENRMKNVKYFDECLNITSTSLPPTL